MDVLFIVLVILGVAGGFIYIEVGEEYMTTLLLEMLIAVIVWFILLLGGIL